MQEAGLRTSKNEPHKSHWDLLLSSGSNLPCQLSRQLQMHFQHARLRVEYGRVHHRHIFSTDSSQQRQILNEVENLYFHHSYLHNLQPTGGATKLQVTTATSSTSKGDLFLPRLWTTPLVFTSAKYFVLDSSGQSHTEPQSPQASPFWTIQSR